MPTTETFADVAATLSQIATEERWAPRRDREASKRARVQRAARDAARSAARGVSVEDYVSGADLFRGLGMPEPQ